MYTCCLLNFKIKIKFSGRHMYYASQLSFRPWTCIKNETHGRISAGFSSSNLSQTRHVLMVLSFSLAVCLNVINLCLKNIFDQGFCLTMFTYSNYLSRFLDLVTISLWQSYWNIFNVWSFNYMLLCNCWCFHFILRTFYFLQFFTICTLKLWKFKSL